MEILYHFFGQNEVGKENENATSFTKGWRIGVNYFGSIISVVGKSPSDIIWLF